MVAHLTRLLGPAHLELAEETVQEAMLRALQTWPYQGVPENAAAWLFRVAHNIAIDAVRRNRLLGEKTDAIMAELSQSASAAPNDPYLEEQLRDDELRLIFMCCHPEIPRDARVALSLKTVGGFSVREIARAFLADDAAIAQRLVRAKRQVRDGRLTLDMPRGPELKLRLDSVLEVVYFMFNEGYVGDARCTRVISIEKEGRSPRRSRPGFEEVGGLQSSGMIRPHHWFHPIFILCGRPNSDCRNRTLAGARRTCPRLTIFVKTDAHFLQVTAMKRETPRAGTRGSPLQTGSRSAADSRASHPRQRRTGRESAPPRASRQRPRIFGRA